MKSFKVHVCEGSGEDESDARVELECVPTVSVGSLEDPAETAGTHSVVASAALWWRDTSLLDGSRIGTIGDFVADEAESAKWLLDSACNLLREQGCKIAVGPMNGNTWRRHRFVVESNGRGPFLLEPRNPAEYPGWWEMAGFSVLSRYSSSVMPLDGTDAISPAVKDRLERSGVIVRKLDPAEFEEEWKRIYTVSLKSFANNFLYTPLEEDGFLDAYRKVRDRIDPDFVRIAERDGEPCGFVFGIPDLEAVARGEKPALIVKTLAVDPAARCAGLGSLLVDELHRSGRDKGYTEAIHALQHETNTSLKITGRHHGEAFRRYALFSKPL
ncbi:MAG: GNAT family N-acetyltransferase [Luteolibacter sp.]|uniref:GNAT family N-acetyltransferase n=1 Tax=Luteolibacter sp. TaxID=1962973 RepID=UPI0032633838